MLSSIRDFFSYFQDTWVTSKENLWYEASNPYRCSNNQGIEGINKSVKESHTFRKRLPLGTFVEVVLRMCHEWSREDSSLLDATRKDILFAKPEGLKLRSAGYDWLQMNKANSNFVQIQVKKDLQTLKKDVTTIYAVKSSNTPSDVTLKDCAKDRLKSRYNVSTFSNLDEAMKVRLSCHLIEQSGENFYCDCKMGIKGHICKHSVALMYKCNILDIDSEVRSKPIGQKRKRGRPKKLPACLANSPERPVPGPIPRAEYHLPSPDTSINLSGSSIGGSQPLMASSIAPDIAFPPAVDDFVPAMTSPIAASSFVLNTSLILSPTVEPDTNSSQRKKRRRQEDLIEMPPPAKRISRQKKTVQAPIAKSQKRKEIVTIAPVAAPVKGPVKVTIIVSNIKTNILDIKRKRNKS